MTTTTIIALVAALLTGSYEIIARFIPTIKDYTILGNVIKFLAMLSNWLNNGVNKIKSR